MNSVFPVSGCACQRVGRVMPSLLLLMVAVSLILSGCGGNNAYSPEDGPADLVVIHGKIQTVDDNNTEVEAVAIRDGIFVAVGSNREVERFIGSGTEVIDAGGRRVVPGLIESHVHATGAARREPIQRFVHLGSIADMQQWVRERASERPAGEWIRMPRADVTRIDEGRLPRPAELSEAAPDHPTVFIWQFANRQIQILNGAAVEAAGITADTRLPDGARLELVDGGRDGAIIENAPALTSDFLRQREVNQEEYLFSLEQLLSRYNEYGITTIFERNSNPDGYRVLEDLKEQGRLPLRAIVTLGIFPDGTVEGAEETIGEIPLTYNEGDDRLRVGPLKIRIDGGILYGSAYMREPYGEQAREFYDFDDPGYRGTLLMTPEEIENTVRTGQRLGWQMTAHVTGDAGVDIFLDAVEAALQDEPGDHRHTLIHAYFSNEEAAERAAELGVGIDTQPAWYFMDGDALIDVLGEERLEQFIGLRTWQEAGVHVALNSDHMQGIDGDTSLNPYNPFLTMYAAITRKTERGSVFGPDQRISREDALRMLTIEPAWLGFAEERSGSIEVGKLGDLAILSDDLMTVDEEQIRHIRSVATIVGGEVVYRSEQESVMSP